MKRPTVMMYILLIFVIGSTTNAFALTSIRLPDAQPLVCMKYGRIDIPDAEWPSVSTKILVVLEDDGWSCDAFTEKRTHCLSADTKKQITIHGVCYKSLRHVVNAKYSIYEKGQPKVEGWRKF